MTNNTIFPGILTCPTSSVSNAMTMGTTKTYVVPMTNASGANKFYIDGYLQASLVLHQGQTYIFDLSSSTLDGHPFEFSTTNNGSHASGSTYSPALPTSITTTGTYADDQKRTFVVGTNTPTLYYYCTSHSGMGGSVTISPKAELIVSGGAKFLGTGSIELPSGTTSERPATGVVGMIRYNTTTGYMESYTVSGWGSIASPPVVTGISPTSVLGGDTATQVFTVTGTGFDQNLSIKLVGADGTEYSVFSTTYVTGLQATFKMGVNGATDGYDAAQIPFKVKIIGGSSLASTLDTPTITIIAPTITNVSPTTLAVSAVGSQTITVTGTGFTSSMASGNKIQVLGADGSTLYNVDSAAVASATSLTFKLAASGASLNSGQLANRPYKVRVTGGAGLTATSTQTIGFTGISWTSPAAASTMSFIAGTAKNFSLVATDDIGGTNVTFSIVSGSMSGVSLSSASASPATYGGTTSGSSSTTVVFRVTDNVSGATADRSFTVSTDTSLFPFTQHTFTSSGYSGRTGPPISSLRATYNTPWDGTTPYFTQGITTGFQLWTVPITATYRITAYGASGGKNTAGGGTNRQGRGAIISGDFLLTQNTKIQMVVGQRGGDQSPVSGSAAQHGAAGGGGSFVFKESFTYGAADAVYVVAGGGGGEGSPSRSDHPSSAGDASPGNSAASPSASASQGAYTAGGGGGWSPSGPSQYNTVGGGANVGFIGGIKTTWSSAVNYTPPPSGLGGFGGGGGAGLYQGAGGGGYKGGNAGGAAPGIGASGVGGGSRSNSTILTQTNLGQWNLDSNGQIIIQLL